MEILIMSRKDIEKFSLKPFEKSTALISITDFDYTFANLKYKPYHLLQLAFNDVPVGDGFFEEVGRTLCKEEIAKLETKYHSITDEQVEQIIEFYNCVKDSVDVLIIQCEYGQSRSAALAAAFIEHTCGKGVDIFSDDRYFPNKSIYRAVLRRLKR